MGSIPITRSTTVHKLSRGKLVTWKADKAYGFLRPDDGGKDVFVHLRDFGRIPRAPQVGDTVTFQRMADGSGRARAADVSIQGAARQSTAPRRSRSMELSPRAIDLALALVFFSALIIAVVVGRLPWPVPVACAFFSLIAFLMYAFDKSAAMNRRWRITENTLLMTGLLGGWPGARIAQGMFRHKSTKTSFQAAFWATVVLNCVAAGWWCLR